MRGHLLIVLGRRGSNAGIGDHVLIVAGDDERDDARGLLVRQPERVGEGAGEVLEEGMGGGEHEAAI
jgi:hypothetical protein